MFGDVPGSAMHMLNMKDDGESQDLDELQTRSVERAEAKEVVDYTEVEKWNLFAYKKRNTQGRNGKRATEF